MEVKVYTGLLWPPGGPASTIAGGQGYLLVRGGEQTVPRASTKRHGPFTARTRTVISSQNILVSRAFYSSVAE